MKIIDISVFQPPQMINYDLLAKSVYGVILRAGYTGYGTGETYHEDLHFQTHYKELKKRGVKIGAYWFSCANTYDKGVKEAMSMSKIVKDKTFELPLYIDSEDDTGGKFYIRNAGKKLATDAAIGFMETLENLGYFTGIYASESWFKNQLDLKRLDPYSLWVANWSKRPQIRHDLWQKSATHRENFYPGDLDLNESFKDFEKIIKNSGLNNFTSKKLKDVTIKIRNLSDEDVETFNRFLGLIDDFEIEIN